jgi:predicted HTH domain antitoxin
MSNLAIDLPDDIMERLESEWQNVPKRALEAIAVEGYRSGALSRGQVGRILGLSWHETEAFLKEREAFLAYDKTDLDQDVATLERLLGK